MSFPWLKLHTAVRRHPKSKELGEALGEPRAWTHIVSLWMYCADFAPDGRFPGPRAKARIIEGAEWGGDPEVFLRAAVEVGFLDEVEDGYIVHDWDVHQAAHRDKIERDRNKAREKRAKNNGVNPSRDGRATVAREKRSEKRGEEKEPRARENALAPFKSDLPGTAPATDLADAPSVAPSLAASTSNARVLVFPSTPEPVAAANRGEPVATPPDPEHEASFRSMLEEHFGPLAVGGQVLARVRELAGRYRVDQLAAGFAVWKQTPWTRRVGNLESCLAEGGGLEQFVLLEVKRGRNTRLSRSAPESPPCGVDAAPPDKRGIA